MISFEAGCSQLAGSSGFDADGYFFPVVGEVRANDDGTFTVTWEAAPADSPTYAVYLKEGTDADPTGASQSLNFFAAMDSDL